MAKQQQKILFELIIILEISKFKAEIECVTENIKIFRTRKQSHLPWKEKRTKK